MVWPNDCQTQSGKTWLGSVIDKQLQVEKFNLRLNKKKAASFKLQAPSLTGPVGDDRMNLERNNMDNEQLKRIADAIEEILRLVKKDMEPRTKKKDD